MNNHDFQNAYRKLEQRTKVLAEADGDVYLPSPEPSGRAHYIFICMEPSLGGWAKDKVEAEKKVADGFRNFLAGYDPMILHFCIRRFLCRRDQRYHITDFSKGAMLGKNAHKRRPERYKRWYPLLKEEIGLVAEDTAQVFAVGKVVKDHLDSFCFPKQVTCLLHYSPQAASYRTKGISGHEYAFEEFQKTVSHEDVLAVAREVIREAMMPDKIREFVLSKVEGRKLTPSRLKLMFNYKLAFEALHSKLCGQQAPTETAPAPELPITPARGRAGEPNVSG